MQKKFLPIVIIFSLFFFSFRLLDVPRGITIDEAAFGFNASLISETLRDENGRFLPVFVLSLQGRDWRQPVAQYLQVSMFKIFGRSLFNLKFVSVLTASFSTLLIFLLGVKILGKKLGILATIIFLTTPVVLIHSHLALDNISPLPFILLWLFGLWNFKEKGSFKYLILAGISLGISFYAHKSMRSAAPIWTVLSVLYLLGLKNWKSLSFFNQKPIIYFLLSISPFYLISPILDYKYAGAVYGSGAIGVSSVYDYFYFYLSNFDLSFLFIKGDIISHHSTGIHGMFLLASLPLLIFGIYNAIKEKNIFLIFLAICFFAGPLFLGFIGSVHRSSRIIFLVPFFSIISAYGWLKLLQIKKSFIKGIAFVFCLIFTINAFDFLKYYWFVYADSTYHIFYSPSGINAYKKLDQISKKENLRALISSDLLYTKGDGGAVEDFSRSLYFVKPESFSENSQLNPKTILLTRNKDFKQGKKIESGVENYFLYKKDD